MRIQKIIIPFFTLAALLSAFVSPAFAATGVIDPQNHGTISATDNQYAALYPSGDQINTGDFTLSPSANVVVSDTELRGYFFGETTGWIVLNCLDTVSGCTSNNGNFKVTNDGTGALSGYAWGENTGWVSFYCGNEVVNNCSNNGNFRVSIDSNGLFDGFAWSQNFGWIQFDCSSDATCTETDWRASTTPPDDGGSSGFLPVCNNNLDDDSDGFIDFPNDPGCSNYLDSSEVNVTTPPADPICSNGLDDDSDGLADFPLDPGCGTPLDSSEVNVTTPPTDPVCSNGLDDDNDGFVDFPADLGCSSGSDPSEVNSLPPDGPVDGPPTDGPSGPPSGGNPPPDTGGPTTTGTPTPTSGTPTIEGYFGGFANSFLSRAISLIGLMGGIGLALSNPEIVLIPFRLWSLLLAFFGFRKKPWGTVYDAVTKEPLDPAYVELKDAEGKVVATSLTDIDGRYGFLVKAGLYTMSVNKTHHRFPSQLLLGKKEDDVYSDLYFGETIEITDDSAVIVKNIPLDPLEFDWNEFVKKRDKLVFFSQKKAKIWSDISGILFGVGFVISIIAFIVSPITYNIVIASLYVVVLILLSFGYSRSKKTGTLVERDGTPLSFAVVHLISITTGVEVARKVADHLGHYYLLVQNGSYELFVDKRNPDGTYTKGVAHRYVEVKKGYIGLRIEV